MPLRARRTISLIRLLRAAGPLPRRRRMPRQQQPDGIRLAYFNALDDAVCARARAAFSRESHVIIADLRDLRAAQGKLDGDGRALAARRQDADPPKPPPPGSQSAHARRAIDHAASRFAAAFHPKELHAVARRFGEATAKHSRRELAKQLRAAVGVGLGQLERPATDKIDEWAAENVDLIVTVPDRYFDRLRLDVEDAYGSGMHPDTLAAQFEADYEVSRTDARRIARDQIGKLNGQLNQARQEALGVTGYTWRTVRDNRVRNDHVDREGQHFEWSDPPEDGHAGTPVMCRCWADPDIDGLLAAL